MDLIDYIDKRAVPAPASEVVEVDEIAPLDSYHLTGYDAAQPVQAAVKPWSDLERDERRQVASTSPKPELAELEDFWRHGNPGVLGAATDIVANTSTMLIPVPMQLGPNGWSTEQSNELFQILNFFRGPTETPDQMWARLYTLFDIAAVVAIGLVQHKGRWVYVMSPRHKVYEKDGKVVFATNSRSGAVMGTSGLWHVDPERVWVVYSEDPFCTDEPYTRMQRGLNSLRLYRSATQALGRALDSQLAMNGILWAKATSGVPSPDGKQAGKPKWMSSIAEWAKVASRPRPIDAKNVSDYIPFLLQTEEKPEHLDVARTDLAGLTSTADWALAQFAGDIDFPNTWLTNGPGTEKYANAFFQSDWFASQTMAPRSARVWDAVTQVVLVTWLEAAHRIGTLSDYRIGEWRFSVDDSVIRPSMSQNLSEKLELAGQGGYNRDTLALELSGGDDSALPEEQPEPVDAGGGELERGDSEPVQAAVITDDLVAL